MADSRIATGGRLFVLTGASASGKTTLLNNTLRWARETPGACTVAKGRKFSERARRSGADDVEQISEVSLGTVDLGYVLNDQRYGLRLEAIWEQVRASVNVLVVVSDLRTIRKLRAEFGELVSVIYISSVVDPDRLRYVQSRRAGWTPDREQRAVLLRHIGQLQAAKRLGWWERVSACVEDLRVAWRAASPDDRSTEIRAAQIRAFHTRYIDHIALFDHVILNHGQDRPEEMTSQMVRLLTTPRRVRRVSDTPVYVVAAASGAGKGTLMENMFLLGRDQVRLVSKLGNRQRKDADRRDGMIALQWGEDQPPPDWPDWWTSAMRARGEDHEFPAEYSFRWTFHQGTEYAVAPEEIDRNLAGGRAQIVISNIDQIPEFRARWPQHVRFVYLHRLVSDADHRDYQLRKWASNPRAAEQRIQERAEVHARYIESIEQFDHVLLNTSYQEDLYDQMFAVSDHYSGGA